MVGEMARALMEGEAKEERLEAIVGPLNRLREAGAHVTVYPDGGGFADTLCNRPDCHITIMASFTDWKPVGYSDSTLADALAKACKALLGEEAGDG